MAYDPKSLSVLAYANGFTLWHYKTADTRAQLMAIGYFDPARDMLREGDVIIVGFPNGRVARYSVVLHPSGSIMLASVQ